MTITEFLTARYDEDEALARAAITQSPGPWVGAFKQVICGPPGASEIVASTEAREVSHHIERHDPARVLADIAAKRAVMALHEPLDNPHILGAARCAECGGNDVRPDASGILEDHPWAMPWPCPTLRYLVQPYADHPDFDESWKP